MKADEKQESLRQLQLENLGATYWDLPTPELYEWAIRRRRIAQPPWTARGEDNPYTGRLPKDKFLVREPSSENKIWWARLTDRSIPGSFRRFGCVSAAICRGKTFSSRAVTPVLTMVIASRFGSSRSGRSARCSPNDVHP